LVLGPPMACHGGYEGFEPQDLQPQNLHGGQYRMDVPIARLDLPPSPGYSSPWLLIFQSRLWVSEPFSTRCQARMACA
jgi:hypothetical protein